MSGYLLVNDRCSAFWYNLRESTPIALIGLLALCCAYKWKKSEEMRPLAEGFSQTATDDRQKSRDLENEDRRTADVTIFKDNSEVELHMS